ncbi:hypothetical protein L1D15_04820 [Vibrio sp. Isolate25]|uniref:hypothetical protein n=1 Tax=unclassified Vibrio TaxID=2614977 RepID=UPI001EFD3CE6|nr:MULTISPECIES: hypothetical protein [unclassified Vibrio]MCG9596043.1 hypothetical protein [Vibrio sp. Isolate25]MCG9677541.1 hypothetical protein [Vibrio sp. Isolate24]
MNKKTLAKLFSVGALLTSSSTFSATLNFDGVTEAATIYNFSGLEFEYFDNDDGTTELFSKQVFIDGAVTIPNTNWRMGILAATFQNNPSDSETTHATELEIKPTYEISISDSLNIGSEFAYGSVGEDGSSYWFKPFLFKKFDNDVSVYSEVLLKHWDGGKEGVNENLVHPMYEISENVTIGAELFYAHGLQEATYTEFAVRPNIAYTFDGEKMLWAKVEIGQQGDHEDSNVDGDYMKYIIGYNMKLNDTFALISEFSVYNWDKSYNNTSGNNYFAKFGLAY